MDNAISGGWNMINSFLHPERGYEAAGDEARRAWEESQNYQRPYWQNGLDQRDRLMGAEDALLDPEGMLGKWMENYEQSPYAKQQMEANRTAGLDAASSMGQMGSSAAQNNIQVGAGKIVNQDRQQYIDNLMRQYMAGIGIGENMYNTGAGMGMNLGNGAMESGRMQGQAAFGAKNSPGVNFGNLLQAAIRAGSKGAGGGAY